jgi:hypothetical protein
MRHISWGGRRNTRNRGKIVRKIRESESRSNSRDMKGSAKRRKRTMKGKSRKGKYKVKR